MVSSSEWPSPEAVLGLRLKPNDAGASTVREYLAALLEVLWQEGESFSGKRPFGNSDWQDDLLVPLIEAKFVRGTLDDDGYIGSMPQISRAEASFIIVTAIRSMAGDKQQQADEPTSASHGENPSRG